MSEPYQLGKTGLHTIEQLRRHIQMHLEQNVLDAPTWQNVLLMELLLHLYEKLESIDTRLTSIETVSWNTFHRKE